MWVWLHLFVIKLKYFKCNVNYSLFAHLLCCTRDDHSILVNVSYMQRRQSRARDTAHKTWRNSQKSDSPGTRSISTSSIYVHTLYVGVKSWPLCLQVKIILQFNVSYIVDTKIMDDQSLHFFREWKLQKFWHFKGMIVQLIPRIYVDS